MRALESEVESMGILDELWYGNISPCERDFKKGSTYSELLVSDIEP